MLFLQPYWGTNVLFQLIVLSYNQNIFTSAYEMDRANGTSPDSIWSLLKYEPISNIEAAKLISLKGRYIQNIVPIKSISSFNFMISNINIRLKYLTQRLLINIWEFFGNAL